MDAITDQWTHALEVWAFFSSQTRPSNIQSPEVRAPIPQKRQRLIDDGAPTAPTGFSLPSAYIFFRPSAIWFDFNDRSLSLSRVSSDWWHVCRTWTGLCASDDAAADATTT